MPTSRGNGPHIPETSADSILEDQTTTKFAALKHPDARGYLFGSMFTMMGDNVEHVITYWVMWDRFHSPALAGFAVISHWLPFFMSVYFGALADRFDCRRMLHISQAMFMSASIGWGVLLVTGTLAEWNAMVLLVIHGLAGAIWGPAEQLMLHDIVGRRELASAVRLNATAKQLGMLCGPAVGSALLLGLGPGVGVLSNVLMYLPLTVWLLTHAYTGHMRDATGIRRPSLSPLQVLRSLPALATIPTMMSMIILAGLGSLFIGTGIQVQLPEFASELGMSSVGVAYGALLTAGAVGAVGGGLLLESTGLLKPNARTAMFSTLIWAGCIAAFAASQNYWLSLMLLLTAGAASLASQSISQTLVQLLAPPEQRGRAVGAFNMVSGGLKAGSGVTIGLMGGVVGVHWSLGMSAVTLMVLVVGLLIYTERANRRPAAQLQTSA